MPLRVWLVCAVLATGAVACGAKGAGTDGGVPADAGADAAIPSDAAVGAFGDSCTRHADCEGGWCVEPAGGGGGVCSRECNDDCPEGWSCREVLLPDNTINLCIPDVEHHCSRCTQDSECPGGACLEI